MDDRTIIREIQRGHKELLNLIAEKYYDDVYRFCRYQTLNAEDSYDLAQETFLRFIKYVEHYRYQNLKGYLITIAMNVCRDYSKAKSNAPDTLDAVEEQGCQDAALYRAENQDMLTRAMCGIPEVQKEVIVLHYFCEWKLREIAKITGVGIPTVKSRLHQGTKKMREILEKEEQHAKSRLENVFSRI